MRDGSRAVANQDELDTPDLQQLVRSSFFANVIPRLWGDYPSPLSPAAAQDPKGARRAQEEYRRLRDCLVSLLDPVQWRRRLFIEGHRDGGPRAGDDEITEALATAFGLLLAPWIRKTAQLNALAVLEICAVAPWEEHVENQNDPLPARGKRRRDSSSRQKATRR
ncbi:MAG: hypothetical protein ACREL3_07505 [Gemmatimonadales bacterium]